MRGVVVVAGLWLVVAGVWVGLASPPLSGGQLIAMPALCGVGMWVLVQVRRTTVRGNQG